MAYDFKFKAEVIAFWNAGNSAAECGCRFGTSKNSIIGIVTRARRSGLLVREAASDDSKQGLRRVASALKTAAATIERKPRPESTRRARLQSRSARAIEAALTENCACRKALPPQAGGIAWLDAYRCCMFPISGRGVSMTVCGGKRLLGFPYCAKHAAIAYRGRGRPVDDLVGSAEGAA